MKNMKAIDPKLLSDNNSFKFKSFKSQFVDQIDVYHKNIRVAIINGIDGAALRWIVNSDKIDLKYVNQLENLVERLVRKTINLNLN